MRTISAREIPPAFPRQIGDAYFKGARIAKDNLLWGLPLISLEAGAAQSGEQLPTLTGRVAGLVSQPALAGLSSAALVASVGCPPAAAAIVGLFLSAYVSTKIEDPIIRGLSWVSRTGSQARRVNFGGDYRDTETSMARRQRALRDIAGALPPARQWLGQEALILHR